MRRVLNVNPPIETDAIIPGLKVASALNHFKNNRIEYLMVLMISHLLGVTDIVISNLNGVCF
jgi:hypothetical protein